MTFAASDASAAIAVRQPSPYINIGYDPGLPLSDAGRKVQPQCLPLRSLVEE
jgi:hypothetical protein